SGSDYIIESSSYKISLSANAPQVKYIGTKQTNYLGDGHTIDTLTTTLGGEHSSHILANMNFATEVKDNRIIYKGNLANTSADFIGTVTIAYTFYADTIQREYVVSNDQLHGMRSMRLYSDVRFFSPIDGFVLFNEGNRIEKNIFPSEDGSWLNDKFNGIFLNNGDSGIYIEYRPTTPFPLDLHYSGSTVYDRYTSVLLRQTRALDPGASFRSVQYIAIGDETTARKRVERQQSIELHPYSSGIIPIVIVKEHTVLSRYDFSVIQELLDAQESYFIANTVNPPYRGILYDEGLRQPQMAIYQGKTTDLVLLPASYPPSTSLSRDDPEDVFMNWRAVIDSVAENNDMALFIFRNADIENPEYAGMFIDLFDYAQRSGLTTTTPKAIADHYRKLQQVSFTASQELDSASISVTNSNPEPLSGVTFRVVMPKLDEGEYQVSGGSVARTQTSGDYIIIYASVNLAPQETRTIMIKPNIERKDLIIDVPEYIIEQKVSLIVRGEDGQPIKNAFVTIEGFPIPFETDAD
ncbi:hypothetical protein, partial [Methanocalculus sp.]|uniref:hypothetical protein n=1 Tax=Methanocalculus sp. TaxID=2004547 RepID=UPI00261AAC70